jgi:hypothetical protein
MNTRILPIPLLLFALAAVAQAGDDPATRGESLLAPFKAELKSALMEGMKEGPATAIEVCREDAPGIAAALSVDGMLMGRSSHKLRNPDNAAPEWLAPIIDAYASSEGELAPVVVKLEDGRHGYAEPIRIQPLCLTCHGTAVHADVADRIEALYPDDQATGFSEGDFRGVFWVSF